MRDAVNTCSIGTAAEHSGLTPRQTRYLESKGLIERQFIEVAGIRQRRYTQDMVDQLSEIAKLRRDGFELPAAVRRAKEATDTTHSKRQ